MKHSKRIFLIIFTVINCLQVQGADKYTDENRPYEFGFSIDGEQHRHEKKDENGIIMGEFGFITADGVYHVTVYATDKYGNFKIISMKNIRVKPYPGSSGSSTRSSTGFEKGRSLSYSPKNNNQTPNYNTEKTKPTVNTDLPSPKKEIVSVAKSCSHCSIPTTTTRKPQVQANTAYSSSNQETGKSYDLQASGIPRQSSYGNSPPSNSKYNQNAQNSGPINSYQQPIYDNSYLGQNKNQDVSTISNTNVQNSGQFTQSNSNNNHGYLNNNSQRPNADNYSADNVVPNSNYKPQISNSQDNLRTRLENTNSQLTPSQNDYSKIHSGSNSNERNPKQIGNANQNQFSSNEQHNNYVQSQTGKAQKPKLISAQMQVVDKNTDIYYKKPGEKEGLPNGLTKGDMEQLLYTFNYTVGFHGHFEEGYKSGAKQGYYYVTGRNGVRTRIDYVADENGFRPKITHEVLDLLSDEVPNPETEKEEKYGLKGYEFKWLYYPVGSR